MIGFIKSRKFRILLACVSLLLLVDMVQDTYAKYISSASANSEFTIAKWSFLVNEQDVLANSDFSNTIVPVFTGTEHIKSGVIAPTSTGYFEVTIDSSNVDVSFDEIITLSQNTDNTVTDLAFTGYTINNGEMQTLTSNSVTTSHLLGDINTVNTYRFFVEWVDGTGETMTNADDTAATVDGVASVNINIQLVQNPNAQAQNPNPDPEPTPEP